MATSMLSPLATPFQPSSFDAVYNNGIPCLVFSNGEHDVLAGVSDEVIMEMFPPSAEELAELEAAEMFVEIMADLEFLEENEERARSTFGHITKRWEARRQNGLQGRPKPAKTSAEETSNSHLGPMYNSDVTDVASRHHHLDATVEHKIRLREQKKLNSCHKHARTFRGMPRPIQQPRKNC